MTKKKSTRATGDKFETDVKPLLEELGFRPTAGSGSVFKDGDFSHEDFVLECKVKNATEGFSFGKADFEKLKKEAKKQGKDWLTLVENKNGEIVVSMGFDTFIQLHQTISDLEDDVLYAEQKNNMHTKGLPDPTR